MAAFSNAYILTLKEITDESLNKLKNDLLILKLKVIIVKGTDGRAMPASNYYRYFCSTLQRFEYILSPGEIGVALGHAEILSTISDSGDEFSLVLEDDAVINDLSKFRDDLDKFIMKRNPEFVHIGCQQLATRFKLWGEPDLFFKEVFSIDQSSLRYLNGTFGYIIKKSSAKILSQALKEHIFLIDDFVEISKKLMIKRIFFFGIIRHPESYADSLIEPERLLKKLKTKKSNVANRIYREIAATMKYRWHLIRRFTTKISFRSVLIYKE